MHGVEAPPDGAYEHVCLSAEDTLEPDQPDAPTPVQIEAELRQTRGGETENALIFDERYLGVRTEGADSDDRWFWLHLAFVDPRPVRRAACLRRTVVAALLLPAMAALLAIGWAGSLTGPTAAIALPAAALLSLAGLGYAAFNYFDEWMLCTRHGRVPVLRIARLRADRRSLKRFMDRLEAGARAAWEQSRGAREALLRDEMKAHRRLLDAGVMAKPEFESARAAILRAYD
jgi:hypothetical protein